MRILLVNWARLPDGPLEGGGVNGYCGQLAVEFTRQGHQVAYLSSGQTYTRGPDNAISPCRTRRLPDFQGIQVFDVINSPVLSPGPCQARDPAAEVSSPPLEAELSRFVALFRPDIVHLHNVEGLSAGSFAALRSSGAKVVFSLHNYHTVCPQVYLMHKGMTPCRNFDAGRACVGCTPDFDPVAERFQRAGPPIDLLPAPPSPPTRPSLLALFAKPVPSPPLAPPPSAPPLPGAPVETVADLAAPIDAPQRPAPSTVSDLAPLDNDPSPDPWPEAEENDYARRRRAFVHALSTCDTVLAVSEFVRRKFIALGVRPKVIRTLHIGTRMTDLALPPAPMPPPDPFRIAFVGYHNHFKGLHCLLDALDLLPDSDLARIDLLVSAKAVSSIEPRLQAMRPRLARLSVEHGYRYENLPHLLRDRHCGIVPSVWWDNGPQTVLEFLACGVPVLGADLGGIPDFITHERNGLLFRGNDRHALAASISRLLNDPGLIARLRSGVTPPKSMQDHANELLTLYAGIGT
ncbi:MAG: hypothetical protein HBSAPP03_24000 [Phycisphaerae bacterium]|nr:MAG: hypothetical protein HBSAPP03_24000 [Phycisphaerae bacterium]